MNPIPTPFSPPPSSQAPRPDLLVLPQPSRNFPQTAHLIAALLFAFGMGFATATANIGFFLCLFVTLVRLPQTAPQYRQVGRATVFLLLLLWASWTLLSLAWTTDLAAGLHLVKGLRMIAVFFLLWPLREYFWPLLTSFLLGIFIQNLAQVAQFAGWLHAGHDFVPGAYASGFMHVSSIGFLCVIAITWYAFRLFFRPTHLTAFYAIGFVAAWAGLVISANRAAMVACAVILPSILFYHARRFLQPRARWRILAALLLVLAVLAATSANRVAARFAQAVTEAHDAWTLHKYGSSVGFRVGMWSWACDAFAEAPLIGVGAGDFKRISDRQVAALPQATRQQMIDSGYATRDHAHSIVFHALATTGLIGLILLLAVLAASLRQFGPVRRWTAVDAALVTCLLAWIIAGLFDTFTFSGNMFGVFCFLNTLALMRRSIDPNAFFDITCAPQPSSAIQGLPA